MSSTYRLRILEGNMRHRTYSNRESTVLCLGWHQRFGMVDRYRHRIVFLLSTPFDVGYGVVSDEEFHLI